MVRNPLSKAVDPRDMDLIPRSGRSPGVGNDNPLLCSCLENSVDRGDLQTIVHGTPKSQTRLSTIHTHIAHSDK